VTKNKGNLKDKVPLGINPSQLFFQIVIVTVDLYSARIYEAKIDRPGQKREYNCKVLDIDVPKIDPPENAIKASARPVIFICPSQTSSLLGLRL
ncbi:MAG TPA: hypothetical protein DEP10_10425, partial [Alphaproteobacteria bacterium]|nr:hypothetical protein [Alphaproteobacteria bacterium]